MKGDKKWQQSQKLVVKKVFSRTPVRVKDIELSIVCAQPGEVINKSLNILTTMIASLVQNSFVTAPWLSDFRVGPKLSQIGPEFEKSWTFLKSVLSTFGSANKNVLKTEFWKSHICPHLEIWLHSDRILGQTWHACVDYRREINLGTTHDPMSRLTKSHRYLSGDSRLGPNMS